MASGDGSERIATTILLRYPSSMVRDPVIEAYKNAVDRSLLRENLKLTVEQRWLKLMDLQRFHAELRRAGKESRRQDKK
jgi:hypothetical protein